MKINLPLLLNLFYYGYNRGLPSEDGSRGDFEPIFDSNNEIQETFCNQFVNYVLQNMGYFAFKNMIANQIVDYIQNPTNGWMKVSDSIAQQHANDGVIVVAAWKNPNGHGHVCFIIPGILENSNSFGKSVPKCVNVGETVFFGKRVSFAFGNSKMPDYFALSEMIS